jgi:methylthioribose-1-phosphate isomerase
MIKTLYWKNDSLYVLDQLLLPDTVKYIACHNYLQVAKTIKEMNIRGAPAIGVAVAYGIALAAKEKKFKSAGEAQYHISQASSVLGATRPTAVNLFWALSRMDKILAPITDLNLIAPLALAEANRIYEEDIAVNKLIGKNGAQLLKKGSVVLTHCNAGALATAGYGTALGVIRSAHAQKKIKLVYVDETRPYLQGARLTAWEMKHEKIPYCLITDNMAGHIMKTAGISAIIVGADRIARNGDVANKIGTYSLAILAHYHKIPFYVAAPVSTIDLNTPSGDAIEIEERSTDEVIFIKGLRIAPKGTCARHPAFDVTPAKYITAVITEQGVFKPQNIKGLREKYER